MTKKSTIFIAVLSLLTLALAPSIGELWRSPFSGDIYYLKVRLPRAIAAWIAGGVLAVSGMSFQSLYRNELASPYTLGVAGGASFGVALVIVFSPSMFSLLGSGTVNIAAFAGALSSLGILILLMRRRSLQVKEMLLAGVALNFLYSSGILALQFFSDPNMLSRMMRWMMGSVDVLGYKSLMIMAPLCFLGLILIYRQRKQMNLLMCGEEFALSRGVNVSQSRMQIWLACSLMVAACVAVCGPIAFVGLMLPHLCRRIIGGSDHRPLFFACFFGGGLFLLCCDTLARTILFPTELPVGIITSISGALFFLFLLLRRP